MGFHAEYLGRRKGGKHYLLRVGSEMSKYGDPYSLAVIAWVKGRHSVLKGLDVLPTRQERDYIRLALRSLGADRVRWERRRETIHETRCFAVRED